MFNQVEKFHFIEMENLNIYAEAEAEATAPGHNKFNLFAYFYINST